MIKKKIAIIGASYLQKPLVLKAKEMGLYTICFAWADGAVCADVCDKFYDISIVEKEQILAVCREERIAGICTIASDVAAPTVAYVANNMGLVGNNYEAAVRANNKYLMREAFMRSDIPCPQYVMVSIDNEKTLEIQSALETMRLPLIVKPSDRSGSLGVTKVTSREDLIPAINNAINKSFRRQAMVEEFIDGREISVEHISYKGIHYALQITDKVTTEAPHFVELAHHQPADLTKTQYDIIYDITSRALDSIGLTDGASHAEYKITKDGRIVVMEIGGRMGGDFIGSDLVRLSTGYDFVRGVIEVAIGDFNEPIKTTQKYSGVYFLCKETEWLLPIIENKERYSEILETNIIDKVLHNIECSSDRSGYLIYQSEQKLSLR